MIPIRKNKYAIKVDSGNFISVDLEDTRIIANIKLFDTVDQAEKVISQCKKDGHTCEFKVISLIEETVYKLINNIT